MGKFHERKKLQISSNLDLWIRISKNAALAQSFEMLLYGCVIYQLELAAGSECA